MQPKLYKRIKTLLGFRPKTYESSLLGLPGELRNVIYRLVLFTSKERRAVNTSEAIRVTEKTSSEPGLLRTCRKIRSEARRIFLEENSFYIIVCDPKPLIPPYVPDGPCHWVWETHPQYRFRGRPYWDNLKKWALFHAATGRLGAKPGPPGHPEYKSIKITWSALKLARGMKVRGASMHSIDIMLDAFKKKIIDAGFGATEFFT